MVTIDAHVHLWPDRRFMPAHIWDTFHWVWGRPMLGTHDDADMQRLLDRTWDPSGSRLIGEMDALDVTASVVMPMDFGLAVGEAGVSIREKVQEIARISRESNGRIFTFAGVDPRRPEAAELLREAVTEWGCRGLKLYPATGWFPDDPVCRPVYETAAELGVPLLFHSGPVGYPLKSRYSRPSEIEAVAADYPDLRIVLGHVSHGSAWFQEALDVAELKPNILVETSGLARYASDPATLRTLLRSMIDFLGADRILYGSDRVGFPDGVPTAWLKLWRSLREPDENGGPEFSDGEMTAILGANADREFHLGLVDGPSPVDVWPPFSGVPFRHRT
jgi:uncharacterized protein